MAGQERSTQSSNTTENHESAGSITSTSDVLRIAGAQVHAGDINIETNTLIVASLQDEATSKSQTRGASIGAGFGSGGVSSLSAGVEKSDSNSSSLWVSEQTQIIGSNSIKIRAKDSTLTGALIAHADVQGCTSAASAGCAGAAVLMDKGNLDFKTDMLVINDLHDISKSKTTGFSLSSSINTSAFSPTTPGNTNSPTGQTTIGGQYYGHETQQITRATLGGGSIMVGGKTLTENSANELGLASINRDVTKAQEITVDKDIGGLNASVTVDNRWLTEAGRASIGDDFSNTGKNVQIVSTALEKDIQRLTVDAVPDVVAKGLKEADKYSFGILPFDSADQGGLLAQLPIILGADDNNQKQYTVIAKDSDYAKAHPELFMPASELPGYADLAEKGKADLDNKLVSREPVAINKGTATFQNFTNGMMNTLAESAVNGGEQTKSEMFTLNYNPRHGFLADILEIGTDKAGIAVTETLKPVSAYTGINLGFSTGVAQGTGDFMQQVMQVRGEAGANFAAHSQGNILTRAGLLGVTFECVDLTHTVTINAKDKEFPNFSVSSYGSPVNNADMNSMLRDMGMLYSSSVAKDGDFVAKFLGGNTGTYKAGDPVQGAIENSVTPLFSAERWTQGGNPFDLLRGDKYEEKNAQGKVINILSPHSSYSCVGICGDTAPWEIK